MYCTKCGAQSPNGSRFCGNCGAPLGGALASAAPVRPMERRQATARPTRGVWPYVILIVLVVMAVGATAAVRMIRGKSGVARSSDAALSGATGLTQGQNPPSGGSPVTGASNIPSFEPKLTEAPNGPSSPDSTVVTQSTSAPLGEVHVARAGSPAEPPQIPPGTSEYLKWLRRKELDRQRLYNDMQHALQMAAMQAGVDWAESMREMMEQGGPDEDRQGVTTQVRVLADQIDRLDTLSREFDRKSPPNSCRRVHEQYAEMLGKWAGYMKKVQRAIANADFMDIPAGGGADREIEDAIADTDEELGAVYERYAISDPPRFHIQDKGASTSSPFTSGR